MLGDVNKLFVFKSLLTRPINVLPLHLKQTFPPIIWIFTEGEGDEIESRLPFKIFSTLIQFLNFQVIYVDYPGEVSLKQIYGTFTRAMLRLVPNLRAYSEPLTNAMVEFYLLSQEKFTQDMQPHYIYRSIFIRPCFKSSFEPTFYTILCHRVFTWIFCTF